MLKPLCRWVAAFLMLTVFVTFLQLSSVTAQSETVTLRFHTFIPPVSNPAKHFLIPWAKKVEKDSKGKLKVKLFWSMQLGGRAPQLLDQVREGVVDIVWVLPGYTPGRMPRIEVFELPFVHKDALSSTLAIQDFQEKYLKKELADYHPLLIHVHAGELFMTKKPVTKVDDLKNRKIRAGGRVAVWTLKELGVDAIGLPLPRIPPALSKGTLDGTLLPYEIAPAVKMQDLVSNFTIMSGEYKRLTTGVFAFLMNKKAYEKLSPELKAVIDKNSGRNIAEMAGKIWEEIEIPGKKAMASRKKNKFHVLSEEETAKIYAVRQKVYDHYINDMKALGEDGKAMIDDANALIKKYSK